MPSLFFNKAWNFSFLHHTFLSYRQDKSNLTRMETVKRLVMDAEYLKEIEEARRDLRALISSKQCAPIMLRLA